MKVNIEIDDDSKFLEALAEEMTQQSQIKEDREDGNEAETAGVEIRRSLAYGFSCVAISCNL